MTATTLFLTVLALVSVLFFGLPMLIAPLRWARVLGWRVPADPDLAIYYGRCLASVILVLSYGAWTAAHTPALQPFVFTLLVWAFAFMVIVHAWGAWRGMQPRAENWEIVYWGGLLALALWLRP